MKRHVFAFSKWVKSLPLLYSVGGALLVVALGWYFFAPAGQERKSILIEPKPFVQQVSVSGKVVAAKEVDLGFSQGGRVAGVYAAVGERVGAGETLAVTENGDLRAALLQRQAALETQQAKLASLKAGTRPEEIAIAQASVESDALALVDELGDAYRAADAAVRNTLDQFISNPRTTPRLNFQTNDSNLANTVENKRTAAEELLQLWSAELASLQASSDLSAAAATAQQRLSAVVSLLSDANAALNRAIATTDISQSTIDSYITDVAAARATVNSAVAGVTAARAALEASTRNLALKQAGSTPQDIAAQEAQVKAAQADVSAAQAQLNRTVITAPFSGTVTKVDARVGKIVSSNTPEISMISAGTYQIESYVPEINIALLQVGDKAEVTLDAYGDEPFAAAVISIDPAETVRDGVSTYRAVLQFDKTDPRIKSGMTASIAITTDTKESVLSVPQGLVVRKGGKAFVRVLSGDRVTEREVTVGGVSSLGEVEILSGLAPGEIIDATLP